MRNGYQVVTTPQTDGKLVQVVESVDHDVRKQILRQVMDTQERQTRAALIAIGWTPPNAELTSGPDDFIEAVVSKVSSTADGWDVELAPGDTWLSLDKDDALGEPEVGDIVTVRVPRIVALKKPNAGVNP